MSIFNYPVEITEADIINEVDSNFSELSDYDRKQIIRDAHSYIYNFLIYPTYNADIKNRIINRYRTEVEPFIKIAILEQAAYLLSNEGDVGKWNGVLSSGAIADSKEVQEVLTKAISPKVVNILLGAPVNLLYAGG